MDTALHRIAVQWVLNLCKDTANFNTQLTYLIQVLHRINGFHLKRYYQHDEQIAASERNRYAAVM